MAKDRDKNSEYDDQIEAEESAELEDHEEGDLVIPDDPLCPRCGWHNTRPSHTKTILDTVFRTFALYPYRCRTCGNRFRVFRRAHRN